jgi:hypothetical protein
VFVIRLASGLLRYGPDTIFPPTLVIRMTSICMGPMAGRRERSRVAI